MYLTKASGDIKIVILYMLIPGKEEQTLIDVVFTITVMNIFYISNSNFSHTV